jgi:hypothetical protein
VALRVGHAGMREMLSEVEVNGHGRGERRDGARCSFCRAPLNEGAAVPIPGPRQDARTTPAGLFCSTHCRDCVMALTALQPSPLASDEFIARRTLLSDRLLELWRRGLGPDPRHVLTAAAGAGSGLWHRQPGLGAPRSAAG